MRVFFTSSRLVAALTFALVATGPAQAANVIPKGNAGSIALGSHWGGYESYGGASFRWVDNNAQIILQGPPAIVHVSIECQGGPSLGNLEAVVRVLDARGQQVDHVVCAGPDHPVTMLLPRGSGRTTYALHVDGGGRPIHGDPRILNFQVFALDDGPSANASSEVADVDSGLRLGDGWYPVEHYRGQTFRWMNRDGRITVTAPRAGQKTVRLDLAVGPSVGSGRTTLVVRDSGGHEIAHTAIAGRQTVDIHVPMQSGANAITLHVASAEHPVPHDQRHLDLQLFSAKVSS
jgi:hypothetical protein